jgi:starch synthase
MPRLKILFAVSECVPFAKTGGLGDVAGALPIALAARGHDVRVVIPRYRTATAYPAEKLVAPLGVPLGYGEAWAAVWESRLPPGNTNSVSAPASASVSGRSLSGPALPQVYLLEENSLFDRDGVYGDSRGGFGDNLARFTFLSRGSLQLCRLLDWIPDVVHVHDWQSSLVPVYLNTVEVGSPLHRVASVLTIHNLGYQGWFDKSEFFQTGLGWDVFHGRGLEAFDRLNLLKGGIYHATLVSTVSPRYAAEIQTPEGGEQLDRVLRDRGNDVIGILNGIDDAVWNPATDKHLAARYSADDLTGKAACKAALQREMGLPVRPEVPLIGLISRLAHQKGIDIFAGALEHLIRQDVQVVVLGSGEPWAEDLFLDLHHTTPNFRATIGMNEGMAHRIEAGADFFVMPSRYEPCGLNQLYSQRYGTLPIVRAVGGLDDTVDHGATGFKFSELSSGALAATIDWAISVYRRDPARFRAMQIHSMRKPLGWDHAAQQYEALYRMAIARRQGRI